MTDIICAELGCETTHPANSRWDSIRAHDAGWFAQKDGSQWCPDHTPAWVAEWRAKHSLEERKAWGRR